MSADLGYINARVRGMKSRLLGSEFFASALDMSDFRSFVTALAQSPYGRDLEEAQARFDDLKAIDHALASNFQQTTRSILNFSDGQPQELIALLLLRYDLNNLKSIARAKHAGRSTEDIKEVLFPAGNLKLALLEVAASSSDMAAAAQALGASQSPLRSVFLRASQQYQSDQDLYALELTLDRAYYRIVMERLQQLRAPADFVRYLQREVDATNLRTALKLRGREASTDELFVAGGKEVSRSMFDSLLIEDSSMQVLSGTSFAEVAGTSNLSEAEEQIRAVLNQAAKRLALDPLSIGVVANYLRMKEGETARLRLLARGKFYGVPRDTLVKELGNA